MSMLQSQFIPQHSNVDVCAVTGRRLGGPPLCYSSCSSCLSVWESSTKADLLLPQDPDQLAKLGCGYMNGKELLGITLTEF